MKLKVFIAVMTACLSVQSFAGFLIDPYIGLGQTKTTSDFATDGDSESVTSIGSRVGYSFILVSAGIDYEMAKTSSDGNDVDITNMSFFVGVDMPILIRAWAEYQISSDLEVEGSNTDYDFKDGYSVGVGFTGLPLVSLNLELAVTNYEVDSAFGKLDFSTATTLLSVSLPLDL
jgi:hypothetical protein